MLLSPKQAAERLGVCTKTIYRRIEDGSLPGIRLSAKILRIDEQDLQEYIAKLKTA